MLDPKYARRRAIIKEFYVGVIAWAFIAVSLAAAYFLRRRFSSTVRGGLSSGRRLRHGYSIGFRSTSRWRKSAEDKRLDRTPSRWCGRAPLPIPLHHAPAALVTILAGLTPASGAKLYVFVLREAWPS